MSVFCSLIFYLLSVFKCDCLYSEEAGGDESASYISNNDYKFSPIKGKIVKGYYYAPMDTFSCKAYKSSQNDYKIEDGICKERVYVQFSESIYGNFKRAELTLSSDLNIENKESDLIRFFDDLLTHSIKKREGAKNLEILNKEIVENKLFVQISIGSLHNLSYAKSIQRAYLIFKEGDRLVVLCSQVVSPLWEEQDSTIHGQNLRNEIFNFAQTFEFNRSACRVGLPSLIDNTVTFDLKKGDSSYLMSLHIPSHFVQLHRTFIDGDVTSEYIPDTDDPFEWNELIAYVRTSSPKTLEEFVEDMENRYKKNKEKHSYYFAEENGFKVVYLTAEYPASIGDSSVKIPGKMEFFLTKVVKAEECFVSLQYNCRIANKNLLEKRQAIKEKMLLFLKSCEIRLSLTNLNARKDRDRKIQEGLLSLRDQIEGPRKTRPSTD